MEGDQQIVLQLHHRALVSFNSGDFAKTEKILQTLFNDAASALDVHAEFFSYCRDLKSNKSLALFHAKNIEKWLTAQEKVGKSAPDVDKELKLSVMSIIASCHSSTANILIKVFRLNQPPNEFLKQFILDLIAQERLKEAISVTCKLGMQDHFDLFDMVLPVLAQNKMNLVEEYLSGCKPQQINCVKMIDSWLQIEFDMIEFFQEKNIFQIRGELLRPKFLIKLLTRWLRIFFNINDTYSEAGRSFCPNLYKQKSLNNLRYLLYRHYVEELSSVETTQELIMKSIGEDKWLQEQVVDILGTVYGDWDSARQWANLYDIKHESLYSCKAGEKTLEAPESDWDCAAIENDDEQHNQNLIQTFADNRRHTDSALWYDLKLSSDKVQFVGSLKALKQSAEEILKNNIVGIDSEWVPDFARKGDVSVALLQIATFNAVHLIDVSYFCTSGQDNKDVFCGLLKQLFLSKDILKIGYGIGEDLRKLAAVVGLDIVLKKTVSVIDLCTSVRHLERLYPCLLEFPGKIRTAAGVDAPCSKNESGLSKLVHRCLGKSLNKCEQMSDWERRPLRQSQLIYAALDAFVLLELWSFIHSRLKTAGINHTLETIQNVQPTKRRTNEASKDAISKGSGTEHHLAKNELHEEKKKQPNEFKVVCDNMLQGLGRQLRCCGVDVRILSNFEDHDMAAEIAVQENRVILTSGTPFQSLSSQVKIGDCFNVPCGEKARDQAAIVLQHYNVKVTSQDIFSRCQVCNGNKYLKVLPHIMRECIKKKQHRHQESIDKSNENKQVFQLPSSSIGNSYPVGRARHIHGQYKTAESIKFLHCIGRSRALNENYYVGTGVSKPANLSAEVNKKLKVGNSNTEAIIATNKKSSHSYIESDDEDNDDLLMVCSSSPKAIHSSHDFMPIKSGKNGPPIQHGYAYEEPCRSNSNSQIVSAETTFGIMKREQRQSKSVWPSLTTEKCNNGVLPFIINPDSLCTQGYINLENITIVSSAGVESSGTSIDCIVTPLQCEQVPHNMLDRVKEFYCCIKCGKVFWEGRHFSHVLQQFSNILSKD